MAESNTKFLDEGKLVADYRSAFIHFIESEAPEVVQSLSELVPLCRALSNGNDFDPFLKSWLRGEAHLRRDDAEYIDFILEFHLDIRRRFEIDSSDDLEAAKRKAWELCLELRGKFNKFIETYGLTTDWLREGLFEDLTWMDRFPHLTKSLPCSTSHIWNTVSEEVFQFTAKAWKPDISWQDFERETRIEFEKRIKAYRSEWESKFKEVGYRKARRPQEIEFVKYLVLWTVKKMSKSQIQNRINEDRYDGNAGVGSDDGISIQAIEFRFRDFSSKYDLPVRKAR